MQNCIRTRVFVVVVVVLVLHCPLLTGRKTPSYYYYKSLVGNSCRLSRVRLLQPAIGQRYSLLPLRAVISCVQTMVWTPNVGDF